MVFRLHKGHQAKIHEHSHASGEVTDISCPFLKEKLCVITIPDTNIVLTCENKGHLAPYTDPLLINGQMDAQ